MRSILLFLSVCFVFSLNTVHAQADKIVGKWLTEEETSHVRLFKATNGKYYGKIVWLRDEPDKPDENNPDESKRNVPLIDLLIMKGFQYNADKGRWEGGTIYDPDNGKTYDCYMWFEEDPNVLIIKGYVLGMKFVGRQTRWILVKEE
jgi:uncharacterized protein (DUF2147 family)